MKNTTHELTERSTEVNDWISRGVDPSIDEGLVKKSEMFRLYLDQEGSSPEEYLANVRQRWDEKRREILEGGFVSCLLEDVDILAEHYAGGIVSVAEHGRLLLPVFQFEPYDSESQMGRLRSVVELANTTIGITGSSWFLAHWWSVSRDTFGGRSCADIVSSGTLEEAEDVLRLATKTSSRLSVSQL